MGLIEMVTNFFEMPVGIFKVGDIYTVLGCMLGAPIIDKFVQYSIKKVNQRVEKSKRKSVFLEALLSSLAKPVHVLALSVCSFLGLVIIKPPEGAEVFFDVTRMICSAITTGCVAWYIYLVANKMTAHFAAKAATTEDKLDDMLVPLISGLIKFAIAAVGILIVLQTFKVNVDSLIGGLGIGAAALALASKDTLANLFGSLVVFFDRPFDIGDWVSLNGIEGSVEEIRLRTTLIRTYDNSVVTMPNSMLTNACIDNYERREVRKMECNFGVLYSTTSDQIIKIVERIKAYIAANQDTFSKDYYVAFSGFGDSSLDISVTAFSYNHGKSKFMADKQMLMIEIMHIVESEGTGFAFPTRTLEWNPELTRGQKRVVKISRSTAEKGAEEAGDKISGDTGEK